jgi:hypothetical protein
MPFWAERVDKTAVAQAFHTRGGVDTGDPQPAVRAFFEFPVPEGVLPAFFEGIFCYRVHFGAGAEIAAGGFQNSSPAGAAGRIVGCSWHVCAFLVQPWDLQCLANTLSQSPR